MACSKGQATSLPLALANGPAPFPAKHNWVPSRAEETTGMVLQNFRETLSYIPRSRAKIEDEGWVSQISCSQCQLQRGNIGLSVNHIFEVCF